MQTIVYDITNKQSRQASLISQKDRIPAETCSQVLHSLQITGKDFMDASAVPSTKFLYSALALGTNSALGLGSPPADLMEAAYTQIERALPSSMQGACWFNSDILFLNEQTCPFCYDPGTDSTESTQILKLLEEPSRWAVVAFWVDMSREAQVRLLALCASKLSLVTSLAVCEDCNWASETAG